MLIVHPKQSVGKDQKDEDGTDEVIPQEGQHCEHGGDVQEGCQRIF